MSEPTNNHNVLSDTISMLKGSSGTFLNCLSFLAIVALYLLAVAVGVGVVIGMTFFTGNGCSEKTAGKLGAVHGPLLFMLIIFAGNAYQDDYKDFLPGLWHALGVGCLIFSLVIVVELVVIGIMGLYTYCANRRRSKQDAVEMESLADNGAQQDKVDIKSKGWWPMFRTARS